MRFSLRSRILLLVTGTVVGLSVTVMAVVGVLAGREVGNMVRQDVRSTGAALTRLLRERSQSLKDQSRLLARQPAFKAYVQRANRPTLEDLAKDYCRELRADVVVITDRDGRVLGETDRVAGMPTDRSAEAGIRAAMEGENWTGVVKRGSRMMVEAAVPIAVGPAVWGTLAAYSAIDDRVAIDLKAGLSGSDLAFLHNGRVIGASMDLPERIVTPRGTPRPVTISGADYSALYAPLPDTDASARMGFVVLRRSGAHGSLFDGTDLVFGLFAFMVLAIVGLAAVAGLLVARSITGPLESVVNAARVVRQGEWPQRFDVPDKRGDEIGLLQHAFNEMTQALREGQERLLAGVLETIQALAAAVDAKDPYTNGHSARVADYSSRLARNVGLDNAVVDLIYLTGTLHDVGKIGVPDAILKKPGRLNEEERAAMETHPVIGEQIVRKAPQLAATLPGVRHHHERWDGRGYPDRLAGEEIPLVARLLAVADTFDAMTSDRPYRKGMDWEIALGEIAKGAGTQFDPKLAAAFVAMMSTTEVKIEAKKAA